MKNLIKVLSFVILTSICLVGCKSEDSKIQENIAKIKENEEKLDKELESEEETQATDSVDVTETTSDTAEITSEEYEEVVESTQAYEEYLDYLPQSEMENLVVSYLLCSQSDLPDFNSKNCVNSISLLSNDIIEGAIINYCALEMDKTPESYRYLVQTTVDFKNDKAVYLLSFEMQYNKIVSINVVSQS